MTTRRLVTENLGYALVGGPVLGTISFLVGTHLFDTAAGIGYAIVIYGLGWALAVRQSERETQSTPDSDDERTRRKKELEAEKGSFGGNGGGG